MKTFLLSLVTLVSFSFGFSQTEVGGITFENKQQIEGYNLVLNGAGVRDKLWIDLYAAGLYLSEKNYEAAEIIKADEPMAVRLHILSSLISSKKMIKAVEEGFEHATHGHNEPLKDRINQFIRFFENKIKKGDVFQMLYKPGIGVVSFKNGEKKGTVTGLDFKKALFGIWLSDKPADDDLKKAMLGK